MNRKTEKIPKHVAFIMDGNRRWAKAHALELLQGHTKGADIIRPLVEFAAERGISYLTFWAFSTENWKRSDDEVSYLLKLFRSFITGPQIQDLMDNDVRLKVIGDISKFPQDLQNGLLDAVNKSSKNKKITVVMALNYGGRDEILQAVRRVKNNTLITQEEFESYLYTAGMPDPDIIVRTGGEMRLSGYLPWQSVYSELFFVDTLWPDFKPSDFEKILDEYAMRERRFGR